MGGQRHFKGDLEGDALVVSFLNKQEQLILLDFNLVGRLRHVVIGCFEDCKILFVTHGLGNIGRELGDAPVGQLRRRARAWLCNHTLRTQRSDHWH